MLPLSFDLACGIGRFRKLVKERLGDENKCVKFIQEYLYCKENIAKEIYEYCKEQNDFSLMPDEGMIVVEKFREAVGSKK